MMEKFTKSTQLYHPVINFYLPHDFGGLGDAIGPQYSSVNLFQENRDIPMIFTKTTPANKNEFNVYLD